MNDYLSSFGGSFAFGFVVGAVILACNRQIFRLLDQLGRLVKLYEELAEISDRANKKMRDLASDLSALSDKEPKAVDFTNVKLAEKRQIINQRNYIDSLVKKIDEQEENLNTLTAALSESNFRKIGVGGEWKWVPTVPVSDFTNFNHEEFEKECRKILDLNQHDQMSKLDISRDCLGEIKSQPVIDPGVGRPELPPGEAIRNMGRSLIARLDLMHLWNVDEDGFIEATINGQRFQVSSVSGLSLVGGKVVPLDPDDEAVVLKKAKYIVEANERLTKALELTEPNMSQNALELIAAIPHLFNDNAHNISTLDGIFSGKFYRLYLEILPRGGQHRCGDNANNSVVVDLLPGEAEKIADIAKKQWEANVASNRWTPRSKKGDI